MKLKSTIGNNPSLALPLAWHLPRTKKPPSGRLFHLPRRKTLTKANRRKKTRTIIYVDGYNLYYGRITGTQYKWLDLPVLFRDILRAQAPLSVITKVKYFTAPALAKFSRRGQVSPEAQTIYHRALESKYQANPKFEITLGKHDPKEEYAPLVLKGENPIKDKRALVWKIVEKKTDVNLAMAMYRDAANGDVDHLVICSNDSDAEPVLEAIRKDFPKLRIGVVTPRRPDDKSQRVVSTSLSRWAHWTRHHIHDQELEKAQLPVTVQARSGKKAGKVFRKPAHWNPETAEGQITLSQRILAWKRDLLMKVGLWLLKSA